MVVVLGVVVMVMTVVVVVVVMVKVVIVVVVVSDVRWCIVGVTALRVSPCCCCLAAPVSRHM